ncbi:GL19618 [Drosophila persimilis]|uniref:GL19618 n=2 Tax=Drosophila persimilis TaxID=7234 RepID=B4G7E4_DROPE|nr:GL19618 [Drosophila persimilis]
MATDVLLQNYRTISRARRDTDGTIKLTACYSIMMGEVKHLGCVRVSNGQSGCEAVGKEVGLPSNSTHDECELCFEDRCNGSTSQRASLGMLLLLLVVGAKNFF